MGKVHHHTEAAAPLGGDAVAPRAGAAQPPLDLSLGHIGTTDDEASDLCELDDHPDFGDTDWLDGPDVESIGYGHLVLILDHDACTATVGPNRKASLAKDAKRRADRKLGNRLRRLQAEGYRLLQGGAP